MKKFAQENSSKEKVSIENDSLVQQLVISAVSGWQLYALARNMLDALPRYSEAEKKAHFEKIAQQYISNEQGMIGFTPLDTIRDLEKVVLPFWLAKAAAEEKIK